MGRRRKNKKRKALPIIVIILIVLGLGYFGYLKYNEIVINKNRVKVTLNDNLKAEINDEYTVSMFVKEVINGKISNTEETVDTSKLGDKEIELQIINKDEEIEKYVFEIEVVDTMAPVIEAKKDITSYIGKDVNLLDGVVVKDNSKEEIKAKVIGDYDKNKDGEYKLKYEAVDSSVIKVNMILY